MLEPIWPASQSSPAGNSGNTPPEFRITNLAPFDEGRWRFDVSFMVGSDEVTLHYNLLIRRSDGWHLNLYGYGPMPTGQRWQSVLEIPGSWHIAITREAITALYAIAGAGDGGTR
jgi:hypothetical protein